MSNNSWVTPEGAEIGRAQAAQARAAGIEPHADMNPILLKPSGEGRMQVMIMGRPLGLMDEREYYSRAAEMRDLARAAYDRLAARYDVVVLEGAGSPAEINLREEDLVNMAMAEYAEAECLLVADIERGGVFASILGTLELMPTPERARMAGVLINKFRGDASLLDPGIAEIAERTGLPVLGVLPWLADPGLEEEDSLGLVPGRRGGRTPLLNFAVIHVPHISNTTDFEPLARMHRTSLRYVSRPEELGNPDLILVPGSKNPHLGLEYLRHTGFDRCLMVLATRSVPILGVCGGYCRCVRTCSRERKSPVWSCYLHGFFDSSVVRLGLCRWLLTRRGLDPRSLSQLAPEAGHPLAAQCPDTDPLDALTDWIERHCDPLPLAGVP